MNGSLPLVTLQSRELRIGAERVISQEKVKKEKKILEKKM